MTGNSIIANQDKDHFVKRHVIDHLSATYIGDDGTSPTRRDPLASPLYADLKGLPPLYVQVGGDETLLDDAARLVDAARAARVDVRYDVYPEQQHVFHFLAGTAPEADQAVRDIVTWLRPHLGLVQEGQWQAAAE